MNVSSVGRAIGVSLETLVRLTNGLHTVRFLAAMNFLWSVFAEHKDLLGRKSMSPFAMSVSVIAVDDQIFKQSEANVEEIGPHAHRHAGASILRHLVSVIPADNATRYSDSVKLLGDRSEKFPRQLAMIQDFFKESEPVELFLLELGEEPSKECSNPAKEEIAWNATTNQEVWIDTSCCHELRGSGLPGVEDPKPRRFRRLVAFFEEMFKRRMFGLVNERDFIERYCFRKIVWNGREIDHIYFNNKECRKVFLQHKPQKPV
jgi:hypothetical protein